MSYAQEKMGREGTRRRRVGRTLTRPSHVGTADMATENTPLTSIPWYFFSVSAYALFAAFCTTNNEKNTCAGRW
jgi:hypothetical protein